VAARSKARKRALDVLFEAELRGLPVLELLSERMSLGERPTPEYAAQIVRGVSAHRDEIDALIGDNAVGWTLERMPAVDRNLLRMGIWELLWADDVPDGVAISEAVLLAQDLSTDGSAAFVNGLLARVKDIQPATGATAAPAGEEPPPVGARRPPADEDGQADTEQADTGAARAGTGAGTADADAGTAADAGDSRADEDSPATAAPRPAAKRAGPRRKGLTIPPRIATAPDVAERRTGSGD
jgi:transcription antitermination protein NusB